jgi:hypothetical protein
MSDESPLLKLPYILPAQAQKHVTHNEALRLLDIIVQLAVISRSETSPPATPTLGDRFIVRAPATGAWAGQATRLAFYGEAGWEFVQPLAGWQAFVRDTGELVAFDGAAWAAAGAPAELPRLGISTSADATNRLAVSSPAILLNHAGDGHQVKVNKASPADTASLLFQTGFSGRAEMGTAGNDDFSVKVSPDGADFFTALRVARASGVVGFPSGVDIDLPVSGTGVQAGAADATANRLLRVGAFGLGAGAIVADASWNTLDVSGLYRSEVSTTTGTPTAAAGWMALHMQADAGNAVQVALRTAADDLRIRRRVAGTWGAWTTVYQQSSLVGTVSQTAGLPTGAVVQRGSNTNGEFTRWADGTQVCWRSGLNVTNASTASGAIFRSSTNATWTFPIAFSAAPAVTADTDNPDCWASLAAAPSATSVQMRAFSGISQATAVPLRVSAVGRWF